MKTKRGHIFYFQKFIFIFFLSSNNKSEMGELRGPEFRVRARSSSGGRLVAIHLANRRSLSLSVLVMQKPSRNNHETSNGRCCCSAISFCMTRRATQFPKRPIRGFHPTLHQHHLSAAVNAAAADLAPGQRPFAFFNGPPIGCGISRGARKKRRTTLSAAEFGALLTEIFCPALLHS